MYVNGCLTVAQQDNSTISQDYCQVYRERFTAIHYTGVQFVYLCLVANYQHSINC